MKRQYHLTRATALRVALRLIPILGLALLLGSAFITPASTKAAGDKVPLLLAKLAPPVPRAPQSRQLSIADRVAYQWAIEEVYWRHRIWPTENRAPKPSLSEIMPVEQVERSVEDYLRNAQVLGDFWQTPLTSRQLQTEMQRMAEHTRQPEVLRDLFAALSNDPFIIAECLVKPALAERLVTNLYDHDQRLHDKLKQRAEMDLRSTSPRQTNETDQRQLQRNGIGPRYFRSQVCVKI